jgi:hypothetical protein
VASLAARRWGHAASGYLGGLPLIGGPITFYLALDHGPAFAAQSATVTLAAILGQAAHLLAFAFAARTGRWPVALFCGWAAYAGVSIAAGVLASSPLVALALALAGLATAWIALPRVEGSSPPPAIPPMELRLRLGAALLLAIVILWSAPIFGPVVSGVLLSVPITGSIIPPFTLALYGPAALARLMRGFVIGLTGFAAFFFIVAAALEGYGVGVFLPAIIAAPAAVFLARRLAFRSRRQA